MNAQKQLPKTDRIDYCILNSLADDYESMLQIRPVVKEDFPGISTKVIVGHLGKLMKAGYVCLLNELPFKKLLVFVDSWVKRNGVSSYWFGMTPAGCDLWEKLAVDFGDEPTNWNDTWSARIDYEAQKGYVVATTRERCEEQLTTLNSERKDFLIDRTSFRVSRVGAWRATYYKTLKDGWKIDFKLVRTVAVFGGGPESL